MNQVLSRVVDLVELELESQQVLHRQLHGGKQVAAPRFLAAALGNPRPFGGNQPVKDGIVALETLVQLLVVFLVRDVNGGDQIDLGSGCLGLGGDKTHDRRFQPDRPILGVMNHP